MTVDEFVDKYRADKLRVRAQGHPVGTPDYIVTRGGAELGRFFLGVASQKYRVALSPAPGGRAEALLPDLFETAGDALKRILQAHGMEGVK